MLYENYETEISKQKLLEVAKAIPKPLCLIGGWAVYSIVNDSFKEANGSEYHGSKDIDLGFQLDKNDSVEILQNSTLNKAVQSLEKMGFYQIGFRLVQHYHRQTKRPLTEEESKKVPSYDIFDLYVDPMVERNSPKMKEALGFDAADEPLLKHVFEGKKFRKINDFGQEIILPNPEVLLAMKLNSIPRRSKDHKKTKDIADVYALIWHSGTKTSILQKEVAKMIESEKISHPDHIILWLIF